VRSHGNVLEPWPVDNFANKGGSLILHRHAVPTLREEELKRCLRKALTMTQRKSAGADQRGVWGIQGVQSNPLILKNEGLHVYHTDLA